MTLPSNRGSGRKWVFGSKISNKNGQKILENTVVFYDPDVDAADLSRYKSKYLVLPSVFGMPIEKEIIKYIYDLSDDSELFKKLDKEKDAFLNEFSEVGILDLSNIEKLRRDNVKKYKTWAKGNSSIFKKCLKLYIKDNTEKHKAFMQELQCCLNSLFISKGLPEVMLVSD